MRRNMLIGGDFVVNHHFVVIVGFESERWRGAEGRRGEAKS